MYIHLSDVKEIKTREEKNIQKFRDIQLRVIRFINLQIKKENGLSGTWFDFVKKVEIEIKKNDEKFVN